jgi:hypothetical protein
MAMAEKQCPKVEIAARLGISIDTFDRRYADLYTAAKQGGRAKLREQLFKMALAGNTQVAIFLAKTVLGMKEVSGLELSGPDGQPIQTSNARERLHSFLDRIGKREPAPDVPGKPDGR